MTTIRSRINEFFTKSCLDDLYKICNDKRHSDNNKKVDAVVATLHKHQIDFVELGPGTNRYAILIDGYVFKIALDRWGMQDNLNEFTVTQEIQPYVVKTYETNELISVCEYVTVISREEFEANLDGIKQTLAILSEGYLLGDVGVMMKNFCNWGYRDNGELCILDFAYIYRIVGEEMLCSTAGCDSILDYDDKFHNLICPKCRRKYTFIDIRRKIPVEHEKAENEMAKQIAYKLTTAKEVFTDEVDTKEIKNEIQSEEDNEMKKEKLYNMYYSEEEDTDEYDDYMAALNAMKKITGNDDDSRDEDILNSMIEEITEEKGLNDNGIKIQNATMYGYVGHKNQEEIRAINEEQMKVFKHKKEFEDTTDEIDEILSEINTTNNVEEDDSTIQAGMVNEISGEIDLTHTTKAILDMTSTICMESEVINERPKSIDFHAKDNQVNVVYIDEDDTDQEYASDSALVEALKEALKVSEGPEEIKEVVDNIDEVKAPERSAADRMREIAKSGEDDNLEIEVNEDRSENPQSSEDELKKLRAELEGDLGSDDAPFYENDFEEIPSKYNK